MRRKKGITLLELLLAMFILAIIAGLGTPIFQYSYRTFFEITTNLNVQGELLGILNFMKDRIKPGSELVFVSPDTQTTLPIEIQWQEFVNPNPPGTIPSPADMQNAANYATRRFAWETDAASGTNNLNYYAVYPGPVSAVISSGAVNTDIINGVTYQGLKFTRVSDPLWAAGHLDMNNVKVEVTCSKFISPKRTAPGSKKTTVYGVTYLNMMCRSAQ